METRLYHKACGLTYSREIKRMIGNISSEVVKLSKAEVLARTGRSSPAVELLVKINEDIEVVEGFLLVAALLG